MSATPRINQPLWHGLRWLVAPPAALVLALRRRGTEHVPAEGSTLVVSNHISHFDPPLLGLALRSRQTYFFAKEELFRPAPVGRFFRATGAFPVRRGAADRSAFRAARDVLARGECLLWFPEGTRHRDGRLHDPFPGAGSLALEDGVTVVPAAIWGSHRGVFGARIAFGPPIPMGDLEGGSRSERSAEAAGRMMDHIERLLVDIGGEARTPS
jgi:1-acyl-sn-glycerol-3-phosphate acyltransferase